MPVIIIHQDRKVTRNITGKSETLCVSDFLPKQKLNYLFDVVIST